MSLEASTNFNPEKSFERPKPKRARRPRKLKEEEQQPSAEVLTALAEVQKMEQERVVEEKAAETEPEKRFKKGVGKLREANLKALEAKRKVEEDRLIEEARAELRQKYEEREMMKRKDEGGQAEVIVELDPKDLEEELENLWFVEPKLKKTAVNEQMAAHYRAQQLLTKEQAKELAENPLEISFFTSGEDPITLSKRDALQEEIDMASESQGYKVDFSDWMKLEKDLRSLEEGGKQVPMKMQTAKERASALFAFESQLRRSRIEAMDQAHKEFPDSFPFSGQDFENLLKQVNALKEIVKKEKKKRGWMEKLKRVMAGPSKLEIELQKAKHQLEEWDEKIADFVDSGKSKLAAKFLDNIKKDLRGLERQAIKFIK